MSRTSRIALPVAIALMTSPGVVRAQQCGTWCGWTLYWENDSFVHFANGTDELYTNGIRFALGRNPLRNWPWVDSYGSWWRNHAPMARKSQEIVKSSSIVFGQNFFTPREITTYKTDPNDRPYAGLLYGGIRLDFTEKDAKKVRHFPDLAFQHAFEGAAGVFGRHAFGGEVQSAVHVLRNNRIPKGWDNQVPDEPAVYGTYIWRAKTNWHVFNVVPHAGIMLGIPQTYAYGGATAALGYHLSGFPTLLIQQNAADARNDEDHALEAGLFAGFEGRAFLMNDVVEGSSLRDSPGLPAKRGVTDQRYGLTVRFTEWRLSYTFLVRRSVEVEGAGGIANVRHNYGSVAISYEPMRHKSPGIRSGATEFIRNTVLGNALRTFYFDASMGSGRASDDADNASDGPAMHVAFGRGIGKYLAAGVEIDGLVRQGNEPASAADDHSDKFYTNSLFSARLLPFPERRGLRTLHVRAGVGGASIKNQLTPGTPGPRTTACPSGTELSEPQGRTCNSSEAGRGYMLGGGYGVPLGTQAWFTADVAWNKLKVASPTSYVMWTFGVGWRP